ncbi:MAG: DUF4328 domain-containing protein [Actinobacteria bacterium]|nr:MAG: DUF4328 domain-containing protein [Actinomycetota bacterium]
MSRTPFPPPADRGAGTAGPAAQPPAPFAPAGYPPPPPPGFLEDRSAAFGSAQPKFAPKLKVRKTPEMLGFRAVDTIGTIVTAIFAVWIPLSIYELILSLDKRRLVHQYGLQIPFSLEHSLDDRLDMLHGLSAVLFLVGAPLFLIWFARAYGNLPTISAGDTQSRTMVATLMWFVPFLQLIRPFGYLKELWTRTEPLEKRKPTPPTLIFVYWFSYVALQVVHGRSQRARGQHRRRVRCVDRHHRVDGYSSHDPALRRSHQRGAECTATRLNQTGRAGYARCPCCSISPSPPPPSPRRTVPACTPP